MECERCREVVFLTSSDQPQGIADDAFLCAALTEAGVPHRWVVWDSAHGAQLMSSTPASGVPICINRSVWTGYDASGAKPELLAFWSALAETACPFLRWDYALLAWICHKQYLPFLQLACGSGCGTGTGTGTGTDGSRGSDTGSSSGGVLRRGHHSTDSLVVVPTVLLWSTAHAPATAPNPATPSCDTSPLPLPVPRHLLGQPAGTPLHVKTLMQARGWAEAVLKPAVGSRGRGVVRVALSSWGLAQASGAMRLLLQGDVLLQPFLPPVRVRAVPLAPARNPLHTEVWGEVCVIFLEGRVVHAVHKHPRVWGWHEETCPCALPSAQLSRDAVCACRAIPGPETAVDVPQSQLPLIRAPPPPQGVQSTDTHAHADASPVEALALPLPESAERAARAALLGFTRAAAVAVSGARGAGREPQSEAGPEARSLMLCRVDLLPVVVAGTGTGTGACTSAGAAADLQWRVSEIEGHWCECFLRAASPAVRRAIACALAKCDLCHRE